MTADESGRGGPQSFGDVPLNVVEDAAFEIRQRADFIGWTDYEREQQYLALADHLLDLKQEWPVGRGAVLYGPDGDEESRDLWHVTDRFASVDGTTKLVTLWDGTHTSRRYVRAEDLLADYTPAGWSWPTGQKPLYHLTRNCGVEDPADLMTDGGEETPHGVEAMNQYRELGEAARTLRENALEADDRVDELKWIAGGGLGTAPAERLKELAQAIQKNAETLEELAEEAPAPREVRDDGE